MPLYWSYGAWRNKGSYCVSLFEDFFSSAQELLSGLIADVELYMEVFCNFVGICSGMCTLGELFGRPLAGRAACCLRPT